MKKTFTINLAGMPFVIDEDAYASLHNYLEAIKQRFHSIDEANEIMQDIEARLAELFTEYLKNKKQVIGSDDVDAAIAAMGKPEDIAGEESTAENTSSASASAKNVGERLKRKLFRNPDDKVLGGVLSGISVYLGIEDSIWLRILFVALFFLGLGSTFLVYIILWIIMPEAKTASEKLQMRGEPVNLDNIQKEVTEAANRIGNWGRKESVGERLVGLAAFLVKGIFKIIAVFIALLVMLMMFVFIASSVGFLSIAAIPSVSEVVNVYAENATIVYTAAIGLFLMIISPLVALLYAALRLILGARTRIPYFRAVLPTAFVIGLLMVIFSGISFGVNFKSNASASEKYSLMQPNGNTLFVQLADSSGVAFNEDEEIEEEENFGVFINGEKAKTRTGYKIGKPHIKLMASKDENFYAERYVVSKGKNKSAALKHARDVNYNFTQTDTTLNLNTYVEVKNGGKWRGQRLHLLLAIPEGKFIRFADNIDYVPATVKNDKNYNSTLFANSIWTVKNGKVICLNCDDATVRDEDFWDETEEENANQTAKQKARSNDEK